MESCLIRMGKRKYTKCMVDAVMVSMIDEFGLIPEKGVFKKRGLGPIYNAAQRFYGSTRSTREHFGVEGIKRCVICGNLKGKGEFRTRHKKKKGHTEKFITNICKPCEQDRVAVYRETWIGKVADMVRHSRHRAKKAGMDFDIDKGYIYSLIESNDFRCARTGVELRRLHRGHSYREPYTASLDRIDSSGGYTKGNVQVVCNWYNWSKSSLSEDDFRELILCYVRKSGMVE